MADAYHRPLITFYLGTPPIIADKGGDFRKLPADFSRKENALLEALIRDVKARQDMIRSLLEDEEEAQPLSFVASMTRQDGVPAVTAAIQAQMSISLESIRQCPDKGAVFNFVRAKAEAAGFFVLLAGDLGSHHSDISVEIFRGYAIADPIAPFIVINDNDSKGAWTFTLLHEIAHILLGEEGVSNMWAENQIEKFCNEVAASLLVNTAELTELGISQETSREDTLAAIHHFSTTRNLSNTFVAYNLYKAGYLSWVQYEDLSIEFREQWQARKQVTKKARQGSGPSYHLIRRHRLGGAITDFVSRMMGEGALSPTKAAKILGVKAHNVRQVLG
ncbi:MAG: ImmA/IrrE family metallo-endopeptidase [Sedimenticola sp.]